MHQMRWVCVGMFVLASMAFSAFAVEVGEVVYTLDMNQAAKAVAPPAGGQWVEQGPGGSLCFKLSRDQRGGAGVSVPVDLSPWRGTVLTLSARVKADHVSEPAASHNGVKCMLHFATPSTGEHWRNPSGVHGTFDWKTIMCRVLVPEDAGEARLHLGLQDSSGTVWFSDVKLTVARIKPARTLQPGPTYKGHNLPRLRGVMSPNKFNEQDFIDLQKWNVNLVRWQITRHWGRANTDLDLDDYDHWIDAELDDLALALDAAARHGIKLVIDLHWPPGGRVDDMTLRMVLEKKYQDHFVKVWQRIATRFKDHPAVWCYDLINEPVQNQPSPDGVADWLGVQLLAARAIRQIDPDTAISIEVDQWDSAPAYAWLAPVDIPNVIYQVHMYWPGQFTHQGVHDKWQAPGLEYPGMIGSIHVDQQALRRHLQPVREFQQQTGAHIYVGEFSAIRWAPGADRFLSDCIEIFEEYGWDWTYHAYREWQGWSLEHPDGPPLQADRLPPGETSKRAAVLLKWFAKNQRAVSSQ